MSDLEALKQRRVESLVQRLTDEQAPPLSPEQRQAAIGQLAALAPERMQQLTIAFASEVDRLRAGLATIRRSQDELQGLVEKALAPPYPVATFRGLIDTQLGQQAVVCTGPNATRAVSIGDEVDPDLLRAGDVVLLTHTLNMIVCAAPEWPRLCGDVGKLKQLLGDGRLLLESRGEPLILEAAADLELSELSEGDLVRFDSAAEIAYEKIDSPPARLPFVIEDVDPVAVSSIGGQRGALTDLVAALTTRLLDPEKALQYGLAGRGRTMLLHGPPGCGKTLRARAAVAELMRISGRRCRFAVVNAANWEDPYVGVTQQNIVRVFRMLRDAASDGSLAVLFIDEVEAIGRVRGLATNVHSDKALNSLLCEVDGFQQHEGVAIIAATNRKDMLDPALLERIGDVEIYVARPDMAAAREIFEIHMGEGCPYSPNGDLAVATRGDVIDTAVSLLYAPNAGNEICTLRFRDGKTRVVAARELVSGRMIQQISTAARQAAMLRDIRSGLAGVSVDDMRIAVHSAIAKLRTTLSRRNAHAYLDDLPQDVDVSAVEPITPRIKRPRDFVNAI